jgi:hypothetical protein
MPEGGPISEHTPGICRPAAGEGEACGSDVAIQKWCTEGLTCVLPSGGPISEHTPGVCTRTSGPSGSCDNIPECPAPPARYHYGAPVCVNGVNTCGPLLSDGPVTGSFGGVHVSLTLTDKGGSLEFDCASGTVGAIDPDVAGAFSVDGTFTVGRPIAMPGEPPPQPQPATYRGTLQDGTMTLEIVTQDGSVGTYTLQAGAQATLYRCM